MSLIRARAVLSDMLGKTFGGNRDFYKVFGYNKDPKPESFLARYKHEGTATRAVNAYPDAIWSDPPEIKTDVKGISEAWKDILENTTLLSGIHRADKLTGLSTYAILLLGFDDTGSATSSTDGPLAQALNPNAVNKLLYTQPYSAESAKIVEWDEDATSERFGLPLIYEVTPGSTSKTEENANSKLLGGRLLPQRKPFKVHHSRVIHTAEACLEDTIYGTPRMQIINNYLDDLLKVAGGTAETYWLTSNRGMQINIDKDMDLTEDDARDLEDEIEEYQHYLRRIIRTRGVEINNLGSDVPDPKATFDMVISLISGATGIPKRILIGSEIGQLASAQDRANWANRVMERQTLYCEPVIIIPLIRKLQEVGLIPEGTFKVKWQDAFKMNPLEKAQTNAQRARSLINTAKSLNENPELLSVDEARELVELEGEAPQNIPLDTSQV